MSKKRITAQRYMPDKIKFDKVENTYCSRCEERQYFEPLEGESCVRINCDSQEFFKRTERDFIAERDPNNYLFAQGRYRTKITEEDLPPHYIHGYIGGGRHGWQSAKGVKYLVYSPSYFADNHLHKYDLLYISYSEPIEEYEDKWKFTSYEGYDWTIHGNFIIDFVEAVGKYSDYDVSEIQAELKRKREWYDERNPKD